MKLSKRTKYIIVLFTIILFSSFFIYDNFNQKKPENKKTQKILKNDILKKYKKEITEIKKLEKTNPTKAKQKTDELINVLPKKLKRYFSVGFNSDDEIQFYGRVMDQYQQPVVGAKVLYSISGRYLSQGSGGGGRAETEVNGDFIINGSGGVLSVRQIIHPDIDFHHDPYEGERRKEGSSRARKARLVFHGHTNKVAGRLSYEHVSKEEPHIFKAWRIAEGASKYNKNIKRGELQPNLKPDARIYTVVFGKRRHILKEGLHNGNLRFSCKRKTLKNKTERRDKNDWIFTLEAVDGGIQDAGKDYYLNEAPVDGYKNKIMIEHKASSKNYKHGMRNKRYYFMANNGQTYGSMLMSFIPFGRKDYCRLKIRQYKYTTDGTRNLVSIPK